MYHLYEKWAEENHLHYKDWKSKKLRVDMESTGAIATKATSETKKDSKEGVKKGGWRERHKGQR